MKKQITSFEDLNCWKTYRDVRRYVMELKNYLRTAKSNTTADSNNMFHEDIIAYNV